MSAETGPVSPVSGFLPSLLRQGSIGLWLTARLCLPQSNSRQIVHWPRTRSWAQSVPLISVCNI